MAVLRCRSGVVVVAAAAYMDIDILPRFSSSSFFAALPNILATENKVGQGGDLSVSK